MSLDAIPTTDLFDTFTKTLCVGYDNVTLTRHSLVGRLGILVAPINNLTGRLVNKSSSQEGGRTIKNLLVSPKDKDPMVNQSGAIYWYQCGDLGCDDEYIGETSRTFGERYKEHLKAPSAIHHHSSQTGHTTNQNNFQIIGREGQNLARNIKESIYIRVNNPSLNNNIGKFNLSLIWDRVLLNTNGLSLK